MEAGKDPRPDKSTDGDSKYPNPPPNSEPKPAPGGVGTGTENDPAKNRPSGEGESNR